MTTLPESFPGAHRLATERAIAAATRRTAEAEGDDETYREYTVKIRKLDASRNRLERYERTVVWRRPCGCHRVHDDSDAGGGERARTLYCSFGAVYDALVHEHFERYVTFLHGDECRDRWWGLYMKREAELDAHLGGLIDVWEKEETA